MNKKTIGIIGGMGPLATADLFRRPLHPYTASLASARPTIEASVHRLTKTGDGALVHAGSMGVASAWPIVL